MFGLHNITIEFLSDTIILNVLACIFLIVLSFYVYIKTNPPIPRYLQIIFISLRVIAVLALFCALFEPVLSYERTFTRKPHVAVLLDESKSIEKIENALSRKTRRDSLLSSREFEFITDKADITTYFFGENISENKSEIQTEATALADAVMFTENQHTENKFDYQILFSDGNSNAGRKISDISSLLKTKTLTVDISMTGKQFDISVDDIEYNPVLFADRTTEINLKLQWKNAENTTIPIQLFDSSRVVSQSTYVINQPEGFGEISLKYRPHEPGQKILTLKVGASETEENKSNNSRSFSVKVLKSKLSILMLSEKPDYELSFLKKYLQKSDKYDIELRLLGKKSGNLAGKIPSKQAELNRYDLIIIHDVSPLLLESKKELFNSYLRDKGGSLWVLLGANYAASQISPWFNSLLPFSQSKKSSVVYKSFHAEPSEGNLYHPTIRIADNQSSIRRAWAELPPFELLVNCDNISPQATVLAYASGVKNSDDSQIPIIGFTRKGPGKILAFSAQPFWNFGFINIGLGDSDYAYKRIIEGSANWLTVDDNLEPIRIFPQKNIYSRGEPVRFDGFAYDIGYRPIPDVSGTIVLNGVEDNNYQADLLFIDDGKYRAEFKNLKPGRYTYQASFSKDDKLLKEVTGQIEVTEFSLEEFNTDGDRSNLEVIASISGGDYYKFSDFDKLVQSIDLKPIKVIKKTEVNLWDKLLLLILFITALSIEWLLRKLNQLI